MKTWHLYKPLVQVPDPRNKAASGATFLMDLLAGLMALALGLYTWGGPTHDAVILLILLIWVVALLGQGTAAAHRLTGLSWVVMTCLVVWQSLTQPDCLAHFAFWLSLSLGLGVVHLLALHHADLHRRAAQQALDLKASFHKITQLATHDELTGLLNRRHMADLIVREQQRQRRNHAPACMAMLDLDHFKRVNDAHGHAAGDKVLQIFARTLRQTLRTTDEISRWGGEEFLLLMPHTSLQEAKLAVERLRLALPVASFAPVKLAAPVTFSAGIVSACEGMDMDTIIACADQAMYRAKALGRNCSVVQDVQGAQDSQGGQVTVINEKIGA
jgi:diguanylate cyclase (GGDEF)-like protein